MNVKPQFFYLITFQYLGYRFHGWQKQPNLKTLHLMVDRTLNYVLDGAYFKTLVTGRTDAMVSAEESAFELFLKQPLEDKEAFLDDFNQNLPQDLRALSITEVGKDFNIIQHPKNKIYHYVFSEGQKNHPFCAPILTTILDSLDIETMKQGAKLFEGTHNFKAYCYKPSENGDFIREISLCEIVENDIYTANFFPGKSYILQVHGKGFMRNQIRLMMGTLINLGRHEIDTTTIKESLLPDSTMVMDYIAPASGLILHKVDFK
ncbi:MAG: tRNA pseudouridine(38-40) synthase TruA [Flavobacteriaceae bacterium]|nr:MAG: tRNA pseudouridine(38-40) synthase TruA [Flavobacteriaceae bacterium]